MNDDAEPQQDGEEEGLLQSAQQMFEKLQNLVATKKEKLSKNLLSSIKKQIDNMYADVHKNLSGDKPNTSNCVEESIEPSEKQSTENCGSLEDVHVKTELCRIGSIKVKNLSLLLDPSRQQPVQSDLNVTSITISSDSEEDQPLITHKNHASVKEPSAVQPSCIANSNSEVSKTVEKHTDCESACSTVPIGSLSSSKHSPEKTQNLETSARSDVLKPDANQSASEGSSRKSILKGSPVKQSPLKNVQFAAGDPAVHTYPCLPPVSSSSSSSSSTESNSDEDFHAKLTNKKKTRTKGTHSKKHVQFDEQIRNDKKYFSKCVVNVQRVSTNKLCNLISKCSEDENDESRTPKNKRVEDMGGFKRKHSTRRDSSDSDQQNVAKEKKKRHTDADQPSVKETKSVHEKKKQKISSTSDSDTSNEEKTSNPMKNGSAEENETNCNEAHASNSTENHDEGSEEKVTSEQSSLEPDANASIDSDSTQATTNEPTKDTSSESESEKVSMKKAKKKRVRAKCVLSDSDDSTSQATTKSKKKVSSDDSGDEEITLPKRTKKRSRIKKVADSSDEEEKTTRKQLRKVISRDSLADTTKQAEREEAERKARIAERQEKYNNIFDSSTLENAKQTKVILDFNDETQEELLSVDAALVKHLKPHQSKGIQFMWDACFESLDRTKNTTGSGCILAHCMGLGKTLQVIALSHTLIANVDRTGVRKILVVCPLSTVLNWVDEFTKWLPDDDEVNVYNLVALRQNSSRAVCLLDWHRNGGVMVLGYDMFRNLSSETNKRVSKKMRLDFQRSLVDPGADLVVCDEGHLLKNEKTTLSKAMNRIKTLRRIVLTGTPLQNNLKEYYCMVQFVKPNLLGTYKEYMNRFVNPITNGQYTDSTQNDICIMRRRSHVLHKLLDGTVQRRDYNVLAPFLPPKYEYVVFISLTGVQCSLYQHYLTNYAQRSSNARTSFLFTDFPELQRICTHPRVLLDKSIQNRAKAEKNWDEEDEENDSAGSLRDFIDDEPDTATSTDSDGSSDEDGKTVAALPRRRTRATAEQFPEPVEEPEEADMGTEEWWRQFTQADELDNIIHSGKLSLLFEVLHQCELIGDKVLVFSQSLLSLNIIEYFLEKIDEASASGDSSMLKGYASSWSLGLDYFRLDGSSSCDNRAAWCKTFNDPSNTRARLFLISTRAGGLGINLVAANRVIIFDVSWNPSHDIQSIYRVYRFGQKKPSYIYRFVTLGTMEMKVYERQVTKQAISKRVIDEHQIDRHYNQNDLQELYKFTPVPEERPLPVPPKDILLGELLQNNPDIIFKYHEHNTLLENKEDEVLNEAERKAAWEDFENEKKAQQNTTGTINNIPMHTVVQALTSILRRTNPSVTQLEINATLPALINEMREQVNAGEMTAFNNMLAEIRTIKALDQARSQELYKTQQHRMWLAQQMQMQFPGLSAADAERILRTQLAQMQSQMPFAASSQPLLGAPRIINPNEIVNLDED